MSDLGKEPLATLRRLGPVSDKNRGDSIFGPRATQPSDREPLAQYRDDAAIRSAGSKRKSRKSKRSY